MRSARGKIIVMGIIFLCIVLLSVKPALAQEVGLEKIVVSAKRFCEGLSGVAENVTVITAQEIENLPARDLSEVLNYIPGVDIEPRNGFGQPTSVTIQGSSSRHVRVMIDGIPINTQSSGQAFPAMLPVENIERIEIIKGASCSAWGSALGGVINVITKEPADTVKPKGNILTSFAEYGTVRTSFGLSGRAGGLGYYLSGSYMDSDGIRARADSEQRKAFTKLSFPWGDLAEITSSFGYVQHDVSTGKFPDGEYQNLPYSNKYARLVFKASPHDSTATLSTAVKFLNQDIITRYFSTIEDKQPYLIIRTKDDYYGLELKSLFYPRAEDKLLIGADFDWHVLKSTYLSRSKSLNLQAPYVNYTLRLNSWDWVFAARYDNNSEFGHQFSPSLGAVYRLCPEHETVLRGTVSRAFNAPPLLWKFYEENLSGITVNPDIKPERAWVYELGLETQPRSNLWVGFSLYRSDVKDAIAAVTEGGKTYMKNFQRFRRQGAEVKVRTRLNSKITISNSAAFNDVKDRSTRKTVRDIGVARQSFNIKIDYRNEGGFNCSIISYYNRWDHTWSYKPNDSKFICDVRISQRIKEVDGLDLTVFLNIYNLTNSSYWADYYFPSPLRYFEGGFVVKW